MLRPRSRGRTLSFGSILVGLVAMMALTQSAYGHKLKVFATGAGRTIEGYAYFPGGGRAKNMKVHVFGPNDTKLGQTTTDGEGEFTFEAKSRCDHKFVIDTADGHRASHTVPAAELGEDLPASKAIHTRNEPPPLAAADAPSEGEGNPVGSASSADVRAMVERAVSRQIRPLREQIERYEEKLRLRDVLGGVGYICGIMGLAFFVLGSKRRREE